MHEILFRGKRIENGKWIEGNLFVSDTDGRTHILIGTRMVTIEFEVDQETVGQYTGLTDKNGKRIFEGDIVRCGTGRICKVTFFISPGVSGFDLVPVGGFDAPPPHNWSLFSDVEIIGNIHDSPELLEDSE